MEELAKVLEKWGVPTVTAFALAGLIVNAVYQWSDIGYIKAQLLVAAEQHKYSVAESSALLATLKELSVAVTRNSKEIAVLSTRLDTSVNNNTKMMESLLDKLEDENNQ